MKSFAIAAALAFAATAGTMGIVRAEDVPPPWARSFAAPPPPGTPPAVPALPAALDNTTPLSLAGSKFSFTRAQIANPLVPPTGSPRTIQRCLTLLPTAGRQRNHKSGPVATVTVPMERVVQKTQT
jgi:hypothetical protein